jgi:hypothetical protein
MSELLTAQESTMATELLNVPEEHLRAVIAVIRAGLEHTDVSAEVRTQLSKWCSDEEQYLDNAHSASVNPET